MLSKIRQFVRTCFGLVCKKVRKYSNKYSKKTYTQPQLIVINCLREKLKMDYRSITDLLGETPIILKEIGLMSVPHYSTLQRSFRRVKKDCLYSLISLSSKLSKLTGNMAIDATGFQRGNSSSYYSKRCDLEIKSIKTTLLVDLKRKSIIGLHTTCSRMHDIRIAPKLVSKSIGDSAISRLTADKGYDSRNFRMFLRGLGIFPIIKYRVFEESHNLLNEVMDGFGYSKRSNIESVNSAIKRKYGDKLRSRGWRMQFKEITVKAFVYNIDRSLAKCCSFLMLISPKWAN